MSFLAFASGWVEPLRVHVEGQSLHREKKIEFRNVLKGDIKINLFEYKMNSGTYLTFLLQMTCHNIFIFQHNILLEVPLPIITYVN